MKTEKETFRSELVMCLRFLSWNPFLGSRCQLKETQTRRRRNTNKKKVKEIQRCCCCNSNLFSAIAIFRFNPVLMLLFYDVVVVSIQSMNFLMLLFYELIFLALRLVNWMLLYGWWIDVALRLLLFYELNLLMLFHDVVVLDFLLFRVMIEGSVRCIHGDHNSRGGWKASVT